MSSAAIRGDFPNWSGSSRPSERGLGERSPTQARQPSVAATTPEVDAEELLSRLLEYFDNYRLATIMPLVNELEKALDQEYRRGAEEARRNSRPSSEPDAEILLDKIFELDAQYQGGIIKTRSRTEFFRQHLCPLLYDAFEAEYRRGAEESL